MGFNSQRKRGSAPVAPGTSVRGGVHSSTHPADRGGRGLWAQKRYTSMTLWHIVIHIYIYIYIVTYIIRYLLFCMHLPYQYVYIYIYCVYIYKYVYVYIYIYVCVYMWLLSPGRSAPRDVLRLSGWLDVSWCPRWGRRTAGGFPVAPGDMVIWWGMIVTYP